MNNTLKTFLVFAVLIIVCGAGISLITYFGKEENSRVGQQGENSVNVAQVLSQAVLFSTTSELIVGGEIFLPDGLIVKLKTINDSRCKPDVQCIWAGELSPVLLVSGGKMGPLQKVTLGTVKNQKEILKGYTITLINATETSATITVSK